MSLDLCLLLRRPVGWVRLDPFALLAVVQSLVDEWVREGGCLLEDNSEVGRRPEGLAGDWTWGSSRPNPW